MNGSAPAAKLRPERPVSPFRRPQIEAAKAAVERDPAMGVVFPQLYAKVRAGFPLSCLVTPSLSLPTCKAIAAEVASKHGLTLKDILSPRRNTETVRARHETFWRCRQETVLSLPQIGRFLGGRDHTTVLHGIRMHEQRMLEATNG